MFRSLRPISLVIFSSLLLAACKDSADKSGMEAAARVGSREITLKQVDSTIKQQLDAGGGNASMTPAELVAARLSVLDNLIQEEALFQKAQKDSLVPDDAKVNQEVQKRKQDAQVTEEQYQSQIKQAGFTEDEVRDKIRRELAINALRERERTRVSAPTDADIEKYYSDHKSEFVAERGADISMIVVTPANNGGEAGAEQKIRGVYEQLRANSDFATVAAQKSEDQASALRGGRLGFASEAQLRQTFASRPDVPAKLMAMTDGQYTEPVRDNLSLAWYIFKLNRKQEQPQNLTLDVVRTDIINTITQQRQQVLLNALVMVTLAETSIKNYLAERIVQNPQTIVEMRPSQLLQEAGSKNQPQPQPRFENENKPASGPSNTAKPATANANSR
ncbi:MAG TPA: SurA N-terminal domain-containing protein [Blastocatellia bacterium]|nr:SurA N-terminal domain-containing protein [Blastocatellia bacterium]